MTKYAESHPSSSATQYRYQVLRQLRLSVPEYVVEEALLCNNVPRQACQNVPLQQCEQVPTRVPEKAARICLDKSATMSQGKSAILFLIRNARLFQDLYPVRNAVLFR